MTATTRGAFDAQELPNDPNAGMTHDDRDDLRWDYHPKPAIPAVSPERIAELRALGYPIDFNQVPF